MQLRSLWKLLVIGFFAFLVAACNPIASFSVSPTPVKAGIEATFDASSTMVDVLPKGNKAKSYAWDFGDGSTGSGIAAKHTYATAGTFKVKLVVVDSNGRKGNTTENIVVTAGDVVVVPATTPLKVITQIAGGVALTGAEVTAGAASAISDAQGLATLSAAPVGENQVITVKKAGYVTQSVRATLTKATEDQQLLVLLMPEKDTLSITDIAAAQTIRSNYLGASVTLPVGALVNASTGTAAAGAATLKLTPWDISGIDLQAMPGNGHAVDDSGTLVDLISAGMMNVEFSDATGNKLQVAAGKTAEIQVDLPLSSIGGTALSMNSTIALWHFDEAKGLWAQEGTGTVVASSSSPVGLALKATVGHFSTWGWHPSNANTTTLITPRCITSTNVRRICSVNMEIVFTDGSKYNTTFSSNGSTLYGIPLFSTIKWTATTADGLIGTADSLNGSTNTVSIIVTPPTTSNFVQCQLPDTSSILCSVTVTALQTNGTTVSVNRYIPAGGATMLTNLNTVGDLNWAATSSTASNNQWTYYAGSATSSGSDSLNISLTALGQAEGKKITVQCVNTFEGVYPGAPNCEIHVRLISENGIPETIEPDTTSTSPTFSLPPQTALTRLVIDAYQNSNQYSCSKTTEKFFSDITNNQNIVINLSNSCYWT
jgi:PKD repeat protein